MLLCIEGTFDITIKVTDPRITSRHSVCMHVWAENTYPLTLYQIPTVKYSIIG